MCATKYPIVLVGGKLSMFPNQLDDQTRFPRLITTLENCGANVHVVDLARSDCASVELCSQEIKSDVLVLMAKTGKTKVNLIGLLDGALAARYMISNLGMSSKTASLTSINSMHRGSTLFDFLVLENEDTEFLYQDYPVHYLTSDYMTNIFNPNTPDTSGLYYQSFSSHSDVMWSGNIEHAGFLDKIVEGVKKGEFLLPNPNLDVKEEGLQGKNKARMTMSAKLISHDEGFNDGLSSVASHKWGNYRGDITDLTSEKEIYAFDVIDEFGKANWDVEGFYSTLANDLKNRGY